MKQITLTIFLFLSVLLSFGQTQLEMNQEADEAYKRADKELNMVYQKILKEYSEEVDFIKNLKQSQRIWIQFRDAEIDMMFPRKDDPQYYGSVFPLCWSNYMQTLTETRTKTLKLWLEGVEEGEMCSGSIKVK